jgi:hypothetical protein
LLKRELCFALQQSWLPIDRYGSFTPVSSWIRKSIQNNQTATGDWFTSSPAATAFASHVFQSPRPDKVAAGCRGLLVI